MIVARIVKDSADTRRVIIDFANDPAGSWLDTGETISAGLPTVVVQPAAVWIDNPSASPLTVVDVTPLTVPQPTIVDGGLQVQMMLSSGTPGLTYVVTWLATGSTSGRVKQIDTTVTIRQLATSVDPVTAQNDVTESLTSPGVLAALPTTLPSSSGILWNNGGVLSVS